MAEKATAASKTLEELAMEITCLVCQGLYREAKLLPCMHYYCKVCIEELAGCAKGWIRRSFPCPECRKDTTLPSGGAEELKGAFFVERLKDLYAKMSKVEGKVEGGCEMCTNGGKVSAFCRECAMFCCTGCSSSHSTPSKSHHVLVLEKEEDGLVDPNSLCQEHNDPMTIFCFTCNCVVCRDCIIMSHSGHNFSMRKMCALDKRREICNSLVPLQKVQLDITNANKNLCETEEQIDKQGEAIQQSIQELFGKLKSLLEQQEVELLSTSTVLVREKKDALAAQRNGLQMAHAEIKNLVEFVEQNLENASDQELTGISAQLQTKIEEEKKHRHQLSLNPVATADMVCDLPSVDVIPKKIGKVSCQSAVFQHTKICDLYRPASSTLCVPSFKEITLPHLPPLADPIDSVQTKVAQKEGGITYTSKARGQHDLSVKVDGRDMVGCPFKASVKRHPSQIRHVVRTICPVDQPVGITFNSDKQLVVAECGSREIAVLSRDGSRLRTIESEDIYYPRGIAVGPEGTFFVTCNLKNHIIKGVESCLLKLNGLGQTLRQVSLYNPQCIRVIRERVYVCGQGYVTIFNTDCVEVGSLTADRCTRPYDIAEGNGSIYVVSNSAAGVIAKFSYDGQFQEFFQEYLSRPRCICVNSDGFIFVTLCGKSTHVSVYHPNGDTVTSFGWRILRNPTGIAVDEDGFVYVCDATSDQVLVF